MSTDQERAIDEDRVWRSQVRKAWYLRRHNFETTPNYNDYLEQVEDLVDELVSKQTREEGKKRLEELRKQFSAETAHNIGQHDAERRQREEKLEQERLAKIAAAQERREMAQRAAEALAKQRLALQDGIRAGTTTVSMARENLSELRERGAGATSTADAGAATMMPPPAAAGHGAYVPALQPAAGSAGAAANAMVQPVNAEEAAAMQAEAPTFMQSSLKAVAEAYEFDPETLARVRRAAGYDHELWRLRYRQEALLASGVHFRLAA